VNLRDRMGAALDLWLDIERQADDRLDDILDDWVQIARTGMLSARDRLELELDRDLGEEAPA
jgi:hypothetical protein